MAATSSAVLSLLFISLLSLSHSYTPTKEDHEIYTQLQSALTNNSFALFSLRNLFFPSVGVSPICSPIRYQLTCAGTSSRNVSFLWTQYNSKNLVGQLLISFAYYGIVLIGFDWEQYCIFYRDAKGPLIELSLSSLDCNDNNDTINEQLEYLTAELRVYASISQISQLSGDKIITYKGYSTPWIERDEHDKVFHSSYVILTTTIALLDFFVFFFSLGICANVYDAVYDHIKCKKNPYYPLFWSVVCLCIGWNIAPGWLVLRTGTSIVKGIIGVMIPLQLLLAIFMKKHVDFPIPGLDWKLLSAEYQGYRHQPDSAGDIQHSGRGGSDKKTPKKYFFWEVTKMRFRVRVALSFVIQTLAVWGLLIFFTYIVIYSVTITISLYLFPIQTLLKIIVVKAVAFCAVFDLALLFSANSWRFPCLNKKGLIINSGLLIQLLTVISFIPILVFLSFIIGGIIFTDSVSQLNGIQGILALLPSAFLMLVGWYTRGTLFPEKLLPASSDLSDLEQNEAKVTKSSKKEVAERPSLADKAKAYMDSSSLMKYGATDVGVAKENDEDYQLLHSSKAV